MVVLAACGGDGGDGAATTAPATAAPTSAAPTAEPTTAAPTTEAPTTEAPTTAAPTTAAPTTAAPTTVPPVASCDEDELLEVVRRVLVPENPAIIGSVTVGACQNGYAQVFALPTETNLEGEQLFLADRGGVWEVVDFGTGIDCSDASFPVEEMVDACVALGLRDP